MDLRIKTAQQFTKMLQCNDNDRRSCSLACTNANCQRRQAQSDRKEGLRSSGTDKVIKVLNYVVADYPLYLVPACHICLIYTCWCLTLWFMSSCCSIIYLYDGIGINPHERVPWATNGTWC